MGCAQFLCRWWYGSLLNFFIWDEDLEASSSLTWLFIDYFFPSDAQWWFSRLQGSQDHVLDFVGLFLLVLAAVPHVVEAYSMVGRTVAV